MGRVPLALRKRCLFFLPGWGLQGNGPAPLKELSCWGSPRKVPASPRRPDCTLPLHWAIAQCQGRQERFPSRPAPTFPQFWGLPPRSRLVRPQLRGQGHHGPGATLCPTPAPDPGAR